jgi:small subunit ribosomal protein S16
MVRIRLRRVGRKKQPSYRIVVANQRSPRDGRYIEVIGFYNPRTQPHTMTVKEDRALYWLNTGAQPSDAVRRIFEQLGTMARLERLRQGEDIEVLVQEAEADAAKREPISPKTSHPPMSKEAKAAAKTAIAKAEAEETEAIEEPAAEAEAEEEAEAPAEEAAEAEEETEAVEETGEADDEAADDEAEAEAEAEAEPEADEDEQDDAEEEENDD